jgi:hypothetical protein
MTHSLTASSSLAFSTSGACCVDTTTARTPVGLPSTYSTATWLFPSGRSQSSWPCRRTTANCSVSPCASMIGRGMSSAVSSQA